LQEVASLLTINSEEHEMGNTCIEQELASISSQDAESQCDLKILLDAEVQCEKTLKRSIAIQTLAQRKNKSKN
jgi:hypothetical protein